mmetsp:Transcript_7302/g.12877  ORF Transcript_7302/g.12877 Transcript_7302/m.12877 type:complete len:164 (-) Transcript_7302:460-951(-)
MMNSLRLALCTVALSSPTAVIAFRVSGGGSLHPSTLSSRIGIGSRVVGGLAMSSPSGWENDDFLNSLGGGGGNEEYDPNQGYYENNQQQQPVERIVPPNELTDEEITMMAMRSAQFYNTDTSLEEAYGAPRQGPPRKQQEPTEEEGGEEGNFGGGGGGQGSYY